MRDVTPPATPQVNFQELIDFLIAFIKNPIEKIKKLPDWNWPSLFVFNLILSIISGVLAGLLKFNFYRIAAGLFLMPVVATIAALLMAMFLYYYFQFFEGKTESYRKLFNLVILTAVPFYLFQVLSEYLSFISVVGFGMSSLLGVVGLCENFDLHRKRAYIVVGSLFTLVLLTWISNQFA